MSRKNDTGIEIRHSKACAIRKEEGGCDCTPTYQANVWDRHRQKRVRKTLPTKAAAKQWRREKQVVLDRGPVRSTRKTIREAGEELLAGMRDGSIRSRKRESYKPSTIYQHEGYLRRHVSPHMGAHRLDQVRRADVQRFVEVILAEHGGRDTVDVALQPLRIIYRLAVRDELVAEDPTRDLDLPITPKRKFRIVSPLDAERLIASAPRQDRALWAMAFYTGLRAGEVQGLDWEHVDLSGVGGTVRVERSWSPRAGTFGPPKTAAAIREIPILRPLRPYLDEHAMDTGGTGLLFKRATDPSEADPSESYPLMLDDAEWLQHQYADLRRSAGEIASALGCGTPRVLKALREHGVPIRHHGRARYGRRTDTPLTGVSRERVRRFGGNENFPVSTPVVLRRAYRFWKAAGLEPVTLRNCRHTFASMLIASGENAKAITTFMGHSKVETTFNVYGLMPGHEREMADRMNAYLAAELVEVASRATVARQSGRRTGSRREAQGGATTHGRT